MIIEEYSNAVATITACDTSTTPHLLSGCLYDQNGKIISLSERYSGHYGDYYKNKNPEYIHSPDIKSVLPGRSIYLGHLMPHYGHFITETLSSFWTLLDNSDYENFVFQPFHGYRGIPGFAKAFFEIFAINKDKVFIIDSPTKFETIVVPERLLELNKQAKQGYERIFRHIRESTNRSNHPSKIYLSRTKNSFKKINRSIINELLIENEIQRRGFHVAYPEEITLNEQLAMYANADCVVGFSGTALHNCLFMKPNATLVEIGDARSGNNSHDMQAICDQVSGIKKFYIPFDGTVVDRNSYASFVNVKKTMNAFDRYLSISVEDEDIANRFRIGLKQFAVAIYISSKILLKKIKRTISSSP